MKISTASFIPARLATLAMLGVVLLGAGSASATTYYWDTDGNTSGFGNTAGTWGTSNFWTSTEGGGSPHSEVTATLVDDIVNFGSASLALGATAANVGIAAGGVSVNTITFGSAQTTAITLGTAGKTITLGGTTPTITVNNATDTISSVLAGTSLDKAGTGVLILTGTNTYNGTTTINAGTLQIGNNGTTGTLGSGNVLNDGKLSFFRTDTTTFNSTMTGTGRLEVVRNTLRLASGANVTQANLYVSISHANGTVEVQSGASLTVSNKFHLGVAGDRSGFLNQSGGTVNLNSTLAGDIQIEPSLNGHSKYNLSGGTLNATGSVMIVGAWYEGTLDVSGGTANLRGIQFSSGSASRAAYLNLSGTGILNIGVGGITDGSSHVGNTMVMTFSGGTLGALANWTTSGNQMNAQKITLSNTNTIDTTGGNITLTPVLTGTGGITKVGTGILTFSGTNTYTGVTTITAGTLALGTNNALPSASALSIGSATLNTATYTNTVGTLDITGNVVINLGTGGKLAFADSSAKTWSGGTLTLTGAFVNGSSVRFGNSASGLTSTQKSKITFNDSRMSLDSNGYVVPAPGTLIRFM